jgi:RNA polymerase sigma factor (sigma-70 family)
MMSLLYIEDEEDYQLLVTRILSKAGFDVRVASTIQQGLCLLRESDPALLILDINLPDGDGYSICRQLRQDPSWAELPIVLLTVKRRPEEWIKGFASGADDYLPKPLKPQELVSRVRACLSQTQHRLRLKHDNAEYLLIQAAVSGNRSAFEVLIEKYRMRLFLSLRAAGKNMTEAEDITSETMALAYERLDQFMGKSSFYTWIYRIAMNQANKKFRNTSLALATTDLIVADQAGEEHAYNLLRLQLKHAVACVPKPYRQMLKWHFIGGVSYQAIARRLKIPPGTVMSRLYKAKELLRLSWGKISR